VLDELIAQKAEGLPQSFVGDDLVLFDGTLDPFEKPLVSRAMLFKSGKPVAPQEGLFATKVHLDKLDQPGHLQVKVLVVISNGELLQELVDGVH